MAPPVMVDTDILIDAGRGDSNAIGYLVQLEAETQIAISVITQMEMIIGCRDKAELQQMSRFLSRFHVLPLNELISEKAVELLSTYRLSHGLLIADGLIAATAIIFDLTFASKNQRDYRFIADLRLLSYP
jgi:predicted nucleic acid-binding protein